MFQTKEQDKTPEEDLSEAEISNPHGNEFKLMTIKMLKKTQEKSEWTEKLEIFNKDLENIKKN